MIKLRITPDGCICGLYTDDVQLRQLGALKVRRASHVEFDGRQQSWLVREAQPVPHLRRWLQRLFGRPTGRVLHRAASRSLALAWEHEHFQPGGPEWRP
ncbi:MAG: hypothetical protein KAY37_13320 [Phycisphaerae bacterium]|nr:hypothetical protein [Phycisphaerae bacterium]